MALTAETRQLLRDALDCHRKGRWGKAEPLYRQVLEHDPGQPDTLHLLGVLKNQMGDPQAGAGLIRQAIAIEPLRVEYHNSLANALRAEGDRRAAAATYEHALSLNPRSVEVLTNLGALMEEAGNLEDAALCYLRALEINPAYGDAHFTLGNLLKKLGNFAAAVEHYEKAIVPGGDYAAEALNNLGTALRYLGRPAEAVERFRRAIALRPRSFEAHLNLADALEEAGRLDEAARMYQTAIGFQPDAAAAYSGAAGVIEDQGRAERATAAYRKAVALAPDNSVLHSNLLLHLHYDPQPSPEDLLDAHRDWAARHARFAVPGALMFQNPPDPDRPLRIGFVSPDFRSHPVGYFLAPVLAARARDGFEFICYSDVAAPDWLTGRLASGADLWRSTFPLDDETLAGTIRKDGIDILVDLAGHTRGNRLAVFARKPAPIQIAWAGYPDTTGLAQMDYLISDRWQTPAGSEKWFVEEILRAPDGYIAYSAPGYAPPVGPPPCANAGYVTFGCFNRLAKINTGTVLLWARLLGECPSSRLVLRSRGLGDETVVRRYKKMFAREGVDPSRLDLFDSCPHPELLAGYGAIDIALDPFPYSGGLTTCEALWMGVPVVTMAGERLASRHSASHLSNAGLAEWIAATPDEYVAVARGLAGDAGRLADLRDGLRQRVVASPLGNGGLFVSNLLTLLRGVWQSWCRARPHIT